MTSCNSSTMTEPAGLAPSVHLRPGMLLVVGGALDAENHAHHAIQVVWPHSGCELAIGERVERGPVVIASGESHRLKMQQGLILLLEPQSDWGELLTDYLSGHRCRGIEGLPELFELMAPNRHVLGVLPHLRRALGDGSSRVSCEPRVQVDDRRIASLLARLDACFADRCLKPEHWRASEVAEFLNLSEGRFLHLFRDQMGIAWRPYLLWRRLLCAVNAMGGGRTATEAAYEAGFSDSAHLSRTFRKSFGLAIREALALFR